MGKLRPESDETHLGQRGKLGLPAQAVPFPTLTYSSPTAVAKLHISRLCQTRGFLVKPS